MNRKKFIQSICISGVCACGLKSVNLAGENVTEESESPLISHWLSSLLAELDTKIPRAEVRELIKKNSNIHYNQLNMDQVLSNYEGNLPEFIDFIEKKWGWIIHYKESSNELIADENKSYCVCPMMDKKMKLPSLICYCSEGFAEKMFSKVIGKNVKAIVTKSILRGDSSCIYKITW